MERKRLARELTDFCLEHKIFIISCGVKEIKQRIEEQFDDVVFVEGLIKIIIDKTKKDEKIDTDKLVELLTELERLRLQLEYKTLKKAGAKC